MNKTTKILIALFLLLGLGYYLLSKKSWRTTTKASNAFAIEDTAKVSKIFMANKRGEKVLLERSSDNVWMVNGKVPADESKIKLLLTTLHDMQIQMPNAPSMHNTVIGILATRGIKTEVYAGENILKTIYVGTETPDKTGTFMMLEGDDETYSVHIPGFVGYLTPRFFITEIKWRNKLIFDVLPEMISDISIQYPQNPSESFQYSDGLFNTRKMILNQEGIKIPSDTQQVKMFLESFQQRYAEGFYDDSTFTPSERDSLFRRIPFCVIQIKQRNGRLQKLTLYHKPVGDKTKDRYDEQGNELSIDPEKFFAKMDEVPQMASVQEYVFRRILVKQSQLRADK